MTHKIKRFKSKKTHLAGKLTALVICAMGATGLLWGTIENGPN